MILTDEEIGNLYGEWCKNPNPPYTRFMQVVAQAQDRKTRKATHDWGDEVCREHPRIVNGVQHNTCKRRCNKCWQSLLKEVE